MRCTYGTRRVVAAAPRARARRFPAAADPYSIGATAARGGRGRVAIIQPARAAPPEHGRNSRHRRANAHRFGDRAPRVYQKRWIGTRRRSEATPCRPAPLRGVQSRSRRNRALRARRAAGARSTVARVDGTRSSTLRFRVRTRRSGCTTEDTYGKLTVLLTLPVDIKGNVQ